MGKVKRTKSYYGGTSTYLENFLQYDIYGRLEYAYGNNHINPLTGITISATNFSEKVQLTYDLADNVLTKTRTHKPIPNSATMNVIKESTDYDNGLRPKQIRHQFDAMPEQILSSMDYTIKNQVVTKWMGKPVSGTGSGSYLQKVDYAYNTLGWLTGINTPAPANGFSNILKPIANCFYPVSYTSNSVDDNDLFSMELKYENPTPAYTPSGTTTTPQYGGNISQVVWQVRGREKQAYSFKYDHLSRMTEANYVDISWNTGATTDNRFTERVQYDVRGNIKHLERYGLNGSCSWGLIDNLNYFHSDDFSYNPTNRLLRVVDNSDLTKGFKTVANGSNYTYDDNGNMTSDLNKNITSINYNYLNLPTTITFTNNRSITFMYDAGGTKLRKTVTQNSVVQYTQDYVGGIEYRNAVLEAIYHAEGRISLVKSPAETTASFKYEYALKDHLANTRLMFCDRNADGKITTSSASSESEVTQENHYYAFGLNMEGATNQWYNDAVADNKNQYNGKEWNDDFGLGMNDYGARMYDPAIGKWNAIDPMADMYHSTTPYAYVLNMPTIATDPNGMACANCGKDGQSMTPPENNGQPMYIGGAAQGTPVRTDPDLPPTFDGGTLPTVTVTAPRPDWQKTGIPKLVKEGNFDKHFGLPMRYSSDEDNAYADRIKYEYAPGLEHLSATVLGTALSGALGEMSLVVGAATSAETGTIIGLGIERDLASHSVGVITWKNAGWQQAGLTRVDWGRALMDNYSFRESFYQAVERASAIRFNVTNFNPIYANPGMTNMEFNHIINNPSLLQKTTFISDGVHVFWDGVKLGIK